MILLKIFLFPNRKRELENYDDKYKQTKVQFDIDQTTIVVINRHTQMSIRCVDTKDPRRQIGSMETVHYALPTRDWEYDSRKVSNLENLSYGFLLSGKQWMEMIRICHKFLTRASSLYSSIKSGVLRQCLKPDYVQNDG